MRSVVWLVIVGLVIAAGAGLLYFSEWEETSSRGNPEWEAVVNPYLAAQRFLERLGVTYEDAADLGVLETLPDSDGVLVIARGGAHVKGERLEQLLAWVEGGGRLILQASSTWDEERGTSDDPLLDELNVRRWELEYSERSALEGDEDGDPPIPQVPDSIHSIIEALQGGELCGEEPYVAEVFFEEEPDAVRFTAPLHNFLEYAGEANALSASNAAGPQLLYVPRGEGWIVVMTTLRLWATGAIGCADNAHLLRLLVDGAPSLHWLANTDYPSLWDILWRDYAAAILLLGLATLVWLWAQGYRVARPVEVVPQPRRQVLEQVRGVARFLWQQRRTDPLLEALRAPLAARRGEDGFLNALAEASGVSREAIERALDDSPRSPEEFRSTVAVLRQLETAKGKLTL